MSTAWGHRAGQQRDSRVERDRGIRTLRTPFRLVDFTSRFVQVGDLYLDFTE
jgi:hypothetical protein